MGPNPDVVKSDPIILHKLFEVVPADPMATVVQPLVLSEARETVRPTRSRDKKQALTPFSVELTIIKAEVMSLYPFWSDIVMLNAAGVLVAVTTGVAETVGAKLIAPKLKVPIACQPAPLLAWSTTFP